jgi:hypothetical protein
LNVFSFEARLSIDGSWGNKLMDGSFSGMVGMLHRNEVDISVAGFVLQKSRAEGAKFLKPYTFSG